MAARRPTAGRSATLAPPMHPSEPSVADPVRAAADDPARGDDRFSEEVRARLAEIDGEPSLWSEAPLEGCEPELQEAVGGLAPILARRGVSSAAAARQFLEPSAEDLHDPLLLHGMERAVTRLVEACSGGERVAVVGDYDVDGVSASALLVAVLRVLDVDVRSILPHRLRDGYGFQPRQVELAAGWGATVIVTVDCGTTSAEAIEEARAKGIDVIVTDHHLPSGDLPTGTVLVNPRQAGSRYPFPDLCGAGLALKLASALLQRVDRPVPLAQLMRIACLGTIADVVPLRDENRVIASLGLRSLAETSSVGLRALFEVSDVRPPLRAVDIGYRIGPRLNAAGRLDSPDQALELLLTRDAERAARLAEELDRLNTERRDEERRAVDEATEMFARLPQLPGILIGWSESWHRGVVGIAAGRVARRFRRPTVLLARSGEEATGSGRSIQGIHLFDFLQPFRELMLRFGGHAAAVGMTVAAPRLETFRGVVEEHAVWPAGSLARRYEYELELTAADFGIDLFERLRPLAPHGEGNPEPLLKISPLQLTGGVREFGRGHLGLAAEGEDGGRVQIVAWNWADRRAVFEAPFEALGTMEWDSYLGLPRLRLVDARPLARDRPRQEPESAG